MNGYIAFYKDKQIEVYASSSFEARTKAVQLLKPRKSYDVTVILCEKNGEQVTHIASN